MVNNDDNKVYLTRNGLRRFRAEFSDLQTRRRQVVLEEENEEELAFIDRRIAELASAIRSCEMIGISGRRKKIDKVDLGVTVMVETDNGRTKKFTIVGPLEANPRCGLVSYASPVGKALMGKIVGDVVSVRASSEVRYTVKAIKNGIETGVQQA